MYEGVGDDLADRELGVVDQSFGGARESVAEERPSLGDARRVRGHRPLYHYPL
jgi:hypothetical protein